MFPCLTALAFVCMWQSFRHDSHFWNWSAAAMVAVMYVVHYAG
jgi:hypothetical protein